MSRFEIAGGHRSPLQYKRNVIFVGCPSCGTERNCTPFFLFAAVAFAREDRATIMGTITDPDVHVIAGLEPPDRRKASCSAPVRIIGSSNKIAGCRQSATPHNPAAERAAMLWKVELATS